jgi:hypothetical protein
VNGATTVSVAYLADYRPGNEVDDLRAQLAAMTVERDQLRALVLGLSDAIGLTRQLGDATARVMADEAYLRGRDDEAATAWRWFGRRVTR